jgi:Na+-driven multidrug efflux pump
MDADTELVTTGAYTQVGENVENEWNPFLTEEKNEFTVEARELEKLPFRRRVLTIVARLNLVALPLFALQIMSYFCIVTDVMVVGRLGTTELAAMGLSTAFQSSVSFIAYNISTLGLFTLISQAHGRSDAEGKGKALQTALVVGLILSIFPVGPLLWFSAEVCVLRIGFSLLSDMQARFFLLQM